MTPEERNPRAFPKAFEPRYDEDLGMSLLDYFAAAALQGYLSNDDTSPWPGATKEHGTFEEWQHDRMARIAKGAYKMADAMLDARMRTLYRS